MPPTDFIEMVAQGLAQSLQDNVINTPFGHLTGRTEVARYNHGITVHGPGGPNNPAVAQYLPDGKVVYVWYHRKGRLFFPERQDAFIGLRIDLNEVNMTAPEKEKHALHPEL